MERVKGAICQSCGMPMRGVEDFGTKAGVGRSEEYCSFCYADGKFIDEGITVEEKIAKNIKFAKSSGMPEREARVQAYSIVPNLKRWRSNN
ncbi:MAG: zinc ribbon domain-containing protein [Armatimonadota bacterium]